MKCVNDSISMITEGGPRPQDPLDQRALIGLGPRGRRYTNIKCYYYMIIINRWPCLQDPLDQLVPRGVRPPAGGYTMLNVFYYMIITERGACLQDPLDQRVPRGVGPPPQDPQHPHLHPHAQ